MLGTVRNLIKNTIATETVVTRYIRNDGGQQNFVDRRPGEEECGDHENGVSKFRVKTILGSTTHSRFSVILVDTTSQQTSFWVKSHPTFRYIYTTTLGDTQGWNWPNWDLFTNIFVDDCVLICLFDWMESWRRGHGQWNKNTAFAMMQSCKIVNNSIEAETCDVMLHNFSLHRSYGSHDMMANGINFKSLYSVSTASYANQNIIWNMIFTLQSQQWKL